jgi:hypothetical protein
LDGVATGTIDAGTTLVATDDGSTVGVGADVGDASSVEFGSLSFS